MKRRWVAGFAVVVILLLAGLAAWQWWPRPVAPGLTPQMVKAFDSAGAGTITVLDGGSTRDAHTLWKRYHDRPAYGTPAESPRLLGISLVKFHAPSPRDSGTYWLVYSDRVWMQPTIGKGGFGTQAVLLDPKTLHPVREMDL